MIIGVDAGMLGVTDDRLKAGVWRVADQLLKELATIDKKNTYRLYSFRPIKDYFGPRMTNVVLRPSTGFLRLRMPIEIGFHPIDVFLGLGQALPPGLSCPSIGCIYDLGFIEHPEAYPDSYKRLKAQTDDLVKRANNIITISQSSKSDIIKHYNISQDLISVIYPGVDDIFSPKGKAFKRRRPYFLFVGSLNKAKDIPLLIDTFAHFLKMTSKAVDLLLVGGDYWPDPRIDKRITRYNIWDRVVKLGYVADRILPEYYRGALAFVTAAHHEGFCLPVVESMACGTPVIGLNRGAIPEIAGGAGLVVEPEKFAYAMNDISAKPVLRMQLVERSLARSKVFFWKSSAEKLLALIHAYKTD